DRADGQGKDPIARNVETSHGRRSPSPSDRASQTPLGSGARCVVGGRLDQFSGRHGMARLSARHIWRAFRQGDNGLGISKGSIMARMGFFAIVSLVIALANAAGAETTGDPKLYETAVNKAIEYFRTKGQAADGSYSAEAGPGVTAIVTT